VARRGLAIKRQAVDHKPHKPTNHTSTSKDLKAPESTIMQKLLDKSWEPSAKRWRKRGARLALLAGNQRP